MLELRPNCEFCDKDLPANSDEACICSYECTFCVSCVENILKNVCPNCGGAFCDRPIRPVEAHRDGTSLAHQPASTERVYTPYSQKDMAVFISAIKTILPQDR